VSDSVSALDVFRWVMDADPTRLSQAEGMVLLGLLRTVQQGGWSGWYSQAQLAGWSKMTDRGVRKVLPRLVALGLVSIANRAGPARTDVATLHPEAIRALTVTRNVVPGDPERGSGAERGAAERGSGGSGTKGRLIRNVVPVDPERGSDTVPSSVPLPVPPTVPDQERAPDGQHTSDPTTAPTSAAKPKPEKPDDAGLLWVAYRQLRLDLPLRPDVDGRMQKPHLGLTPSAGARKALRSIAIAAGSTERAGVYLAWVFQSLDERAAQLRGDAPWPDGRLIFRALDLASLARQESIDGRLQMADAWDARGRTAPTNGEHRARDAPTNGRASRMDATDEAIDSFLSRHRQPAGVP
jgi:hypothetical protein